MVHIHANTQHHRAARALQSGGTGKLVRLMAVSRTQGLRAGDTVVLRTPMLPMTAFAEWGSLGDASATRRYMAALLELPEVCEALFGIRARRPNSMA